MISENLGKKRKWSSRIGGHSRLGRKDETGTTVVGPVPGSITAGVVGRLTCGTMTRTKKSG